MNKTIIMGLSLFSALSAFAATNCQLDNKTVADSDHRNLYICKNGKKKFKARCHGSTDAEFKTDPIKKGTWKKFGENEGIDFKDGFVVCTKKVK